MMTFMARREVEVLMASGSKLVSGPGGCKIRDGGDAWRATYDGAGREPMLVPRAVVPADVAPARVTPPPLAQAALVPSRP
jgi:hypothetical protein